MDEPNNCKCGGYAKIKRSKFGYLVSCDDCGKSTHVWKKDIGTAIDAWNAMVAVEDDYKVLYKELINYFCNAWCNSDECGTSICPIYGITKRAEALELDG